MPGTDQVLAVLAGRYQEALTRLGDSTSRLVGVLWDAVGGISDEAQAAFAARAAEVVAAAQRQAAVLADAYIRNYVALATGAPLQAATIDFPAIVANARLGVTGAVVYARPTVTLRTQLGAGQAFDTAMRIARDRATVAGDQDVKLAARAAAHESMRASGVKWYRRVPDANACTFCLVASTQRYRAKQLMPLHAHCSCTVAPLVGASAADPIVDRDLLGRLQAASDRPDYWNDPKAVIAVRHHGELGPVLGKAGDHFTGPAHLVA